MKYIPQFFFCISQRQAPIFKDINFSCPHTDKKIYKAIVYLTGNPNYENSYLASMKEITLYTQQHHLALVLQMNYDILLTQFQVSIALYLNIEYFKMYLRYKH